MTIAEKYPILKNWIDGNVVEASDLAIELDIARDLVSELPGQGLGPVPHEHYAHVKTHLYKRIEVIKERAERAEALLIDIIDKHHRTLTGSSLHNPEHQDWPECTCLTCVAVRVLLPEQAEDALVRYQNDRSTQGPHTETNATHD